jgi:hypothetical protein
MSAMLARSCLNSLARHSGMLAAGLALLMFGANVFANAGQPTIEMFDAPGAGSNGAMHQGTFVYA